MKSGEEGREFMSRACPQSINMALHDPAHNVSGFGDFWRFSGDLGGFGRSNPAQPGETTHNSMSEARPRYDRDAEASLEEMRLERDKG